MDRLGDYRLRKRLAVGGMGEVYLGEKVGPEGFVKPVVLKCVLPQLTKDRAFVQLFLDEARLAALLHHPNIAQVYDFGLVQETYFIAMEYVPGYTVDEIRRKLRSIDQRMPLEHVANIASQVCQGLSYAHRLTDGKGVGLGLVHRDVSPHNLIVSVDGTVKIVDFGIAKARSGLTRVQAKGAVGKFGYMSPEQSRGESVDGRSDVFSLGVCLWELTTTERLHDPKLDAAPAYHPSRPVRGVETLRTDVPRQFSQILESALAIQPEDRFDSAQSMHMALERFQAAMTHYAGQAALADYIKGLVEGRPPPVRGGSLVEPAGQPRPARSEELEGAQKYEEVFGVTMERPRGRSKVHSVPEAWRVSDVRPPPGTADRGRMTPTESAGLEGDGGPRTPPDALSRTPTPPRELEIDRRMEVPELAVEPVAVRPRPLPAPAAPPRARMRLMPVLLVVGLGVAAGLGIGYRAELGEWAVGAPPPAPVLTNRYRIESQPPQASVWLDGVEKAGRTPLEVELIPDVSYLIEVRLEGHATAFQQVDARVANEVQVLSFRMEPAGTLEITSRPPGATVTVEGRVVRGRTTPMTLEDVPADRPIRVRVALSSGPAAVRSVTVPAGRRRKLRFALD
jgi:hypothetical protein